MIDGTETASDVQKRGAEKIAKMARAILDERGWSLRQAELKTGVKYTTVQNIQSGVSVGAKTLASFALSVAQDPDVWVIISLTSTPARFLSDSDIQKLPEVVRAEFQKEKMHFQQGK